MNRENREFWLLVGSQELYGAAVLETVARRAQEMAAYISASGCVPRRLVFKGVVRSDADAVRFCREASFDERCCGVVAWCHTFSPGKMWINGLSLLQKPYCHFATQYHREIPNDGIDMDFMNLNQAAHGDRELGYTEARLRLARKVIFGHWQDAEPLRALGLWMRAALGWAESRTLRVMRFGDNMREVAVTEGDKVETQRKLGWQVNTWAVGDLAEELRAVSDAETAALTEEYLDAYTLATEDRESVACQAREELAIRRMLDREGCTAFSDTFQDLHGLPQLPGLAAQHLMALGYGFGGEGDWKTAALLRVVGAMCEGMGGGSGFMEDYTYHLAGERSCVLGSHMLEVSPALAAGRPEIRTHPLGIGRNSSDPARLVFEGKPGPCTLTSLVDMGGRLRLIVQEAEAIRPILPMPNLPVARVMWRPLPDLAGGVPMWIMAGGSHHTVFSYDADAALLESWADMMDIEFVRIGRGTEPAALKKELMLGDLLWKLR